MCGIAGQIGLNKNKEQLQDELIAMCDAIIHRGPDDAGYYVDSKLSVAIGMRRLSIIDLAGGKQPFFSECGKVVCVVNGEIYNYQSLRKELIDRGHTFSTNSDCETVLHAYETWGSRCLEKIEGMFGITIWDSDSEELFLARDRFGIKPLYYSCSSDTFAFGSEIKSILQLSDATRKINQQALAHYLWNCAVPDPLTIFQGIKKLPPGHFLTVSYRNITNCVPKRYWRLDVHLTKDAPVTTDSMEYEFRSSIRTHLQSDVPVGILLSGGVDSSAVTAIATREYSGALNTFSVEFDRPGYSEFEYAREVAKRYKTKHHEVTIAPSEYLNLTKKSIYLMDEPICDLAMPAMYRICDYAKDYVKVLLSGEGADEMLGGYVNRINEAHCSLQPLERLRHLIRTERGSRIKRLLNGLKNWPNALSIPPEIWLLKKENLGWNYHDVAKLLADYPPNILEPFNHWQTSDEMIDRWKNNAQSIQERLLYLDTNVNLPAILLMKADKMSMGASIELRVPFLGDQFSRYTTRLPDSAKIQNGHGKFLLKKSLEPYLDQKLLYRRKQGWPVPIGEWIRDELKDFSYQILFDSKAITQTKICKNQLKQHWQAHQDGQKDLGKQLWQIVLFEIFYNSLES